MQEWHSTGLAGRTSPRDLSASKIDAFFNFGERRIIENRRGPALKLALALQMSGRLLEAARIAPPLVEQIGVVAHVL